MTSKVDGGGVANSWFVPCVRCVFTCTGHLSVQMLGPSPRGVRASSGSLVKDEREKISRPRASSKEHGRCSSHRRGWAVHSLRLGRPQQWWILRRCPHRLWCFALPLSRAVCRAPSRTPCAALVLSGCMRGCALAYADRQWPRLLLWLRSFRSPGPRGRRQPGSPSARRGENLAVEIGNQEQHQRTR